jgi:hypothetical protein
MGENAMKQRKKNMSWQNDTKKLKMCDQVAETRLTTSYGKATHCNKMEGTSAPGCPFCSAKLTPWQCREIEEQRRKSNMTKEVWEKGEEYVKKSDYTTDYRHQDPNKNEERAKKTTKETANGQDKDRQRKL